jgi:ATP-dependent Clp protease ATP-binding subunit ClpC
MKLFKKLINLINKIKKFIKNTMAKINFKDLMKGIDSNSDSIPDEPINFDSTTDNTDKEADESQPGPKFDPETMKFIDKMINESSDSDKQDFLKMTGNKIIEDLSKLLTERAKKVMQSIVNVNGKITLPQLFHHLFRGIITKEHRDIFLENADDSVLCKYVDSKPEDETKQFLQRLTDIATKSGQNMESIPMSEVLTNLNNFGNFVVNCVHGFKDFNKIMLTQAENKVSKDNYQRMQKLFDDHKFSIEDFIILMLQMLGFYKKDTGNEAIRKIIKEVAPDELVDALDDYGLLDESISGEWRNNYFKSLLSDAAEMVGGGSFMSGMKMPELETITQEEFVQAGSDGSRKVGKKDDLDIKVEDDSEESDTPYLDHYSEDLCLQAKKGEIDPLIGRDKEMRSLFEILCSRKKKSAVLIGPAGSGKTSLVEHLATLIVNDKVPEPLKGVRLVSLPVSSIEAGASVRGELEGRISNILTEIRRSKQKIIVYMDEMHQLGSAVDGKNISDIMKPYIANGSVTVIGSTTNQEFRKYIEKDRALERRFGKIIIEEPTIEETIDILKKSINIYSDTHKVQYPDDVIEFAVRTAARYIHDNSNPDLSLGILDRAGSACKIDHSATYKKLERKKSIITKELEKLKTKKTNLVFESEDDPTKLDSARLIDVQIDQLEKDLESLTNPAAEDKTKWPKVTIKDVANVISYAANVPVDTIIEPEIDKLARLKSEISKVVIGQESAVETMARALCRSYLGLRNPNKPIASFMFIGPTGVGKTELAKKTAEIVFGSPEALLRIDGGEFSMQHTDTKLLGAPPSYIGYDQPPVFDKIRKRPYTLVLVDEVEKIHPDIVNKVFLSILDEGFVTLSDQTKVDLRNCVIVFTGNIGSDAVNRISFNLTETKEESEKAKSEMYRSALKSYFRPEFLGRLTDIICFNSLNHDKMREVLDLELKKFESRTGKSITLADDVKDFLVSKADDKFGARNLGQVIQKELEDKIADQILATPALIKKKKVAVTLKDGDLIVTLK